MHANIITYPLASEYLDRATAGIKEGTRETARIPGFKHGHFIYDREHSLMTIVMLFDTAEQAAAAWAHAEPEVSANVRAMGSSLTVRVGEVVHDV
jgi:hypothetical protein